MARGSYECAHCGLTVEPGSFSLWNPQLGKYEAVCRACYDLKRPYAKREK